MNEARTCIYCRQTKKPEEFNREHVMPTSFGGFEPDNPVLRCVCRSCNTFFGRKYDDPLAKQYGMQRYTFHRGTKRARERRDKFRMKPGPGIQIIPDGGRPDLDYELRHNPETNSLVVEAAWGARVTYPDKRVENFQLEQLPRSEQLPKGATVELFGLAAEQAREFLRLRGFVGTPETTSLWPEKKDPENLEFTIETKFSGTHVAAFIKIAFNLMIHSLGYEFATRKEFDFIRSFLLEQSASFPKNQIKPIIHPLTTDEDQIPVAHILALKVAHSPFRIVAIVCPYNQFGLAIQLASEPWADSVPDEAEHTLFFNLVSTEAPVGVVDKLARNPGDQRERQFARRFRLEMPDFK